MTERPVNEMINVSKEEPEYCTACCEDLHAVRAGDLWVASSRRRSKCKLYRSGCCASFGGSEQEAIAAFVPLVQQVAPTSSGETE